MASRTKQKEAARARRLAEERAQAGQAQRRRRLQMLTGVVIAAVVVVAVAIAISVGGGGGSTPAPTSAAGKAAAANVDRLLSGIPQSANVLGSPGAKVTVTEWGDLECPICRDFALGAENTLIDKDVRSGKVKLAYRSLETATGNGPNASVFPTQQAAALAAGLQGRAWHYILLFYSQQGHEGTGYVTDSYLDGLARQVPGLNYSKWLSDRKSSSLTSQVAQDAQAASVQGFNSTPTIVVQGPKGTAQAIAGNTSYSQLASQIHSVE